MCVAAGCMGGNKLDSAAVRKLEKLPTKTQMIGSVAIMVKKVRCAAPAGLITIYYCCQLFDEHIRRGCHELISLTSDTLQYQIAA